MITLEEFKYRRTNKVMEEFNIDILIASSNGNVFYLSDFESHKIINTAEVYLLFNRENGEKIIVAPLASAPTILEITSNIKLYCYGEFYFAFNKKKEINYKNIKSIIQKNYKLAEEALIAAIKDTGVKKGKIGFDESKVKPQTWNNVCSNFPEIEFLPSAKLFAEIRKIKHLDEIRLLERSSTIAEESLVEVIKKIDLGLTEEQIGKMYILEVTKRKGLPNFNVVTIDERSAYSDTINTKKKVKDGSILRFDVGCVYRGYCSDMARTVAVGNYDEKYREYYNYLLNGEKAAINAIKPGITSQEIFQIAVKTVRKGIPHYCRNHCGHGIGIEGYNPPLIASGVLDKIQVGMVLNIETPYYELGWGGMQIEDTIVVEKNGIKYLTNSDRKLIEK